MKPRRSWPSILLALTALAAWPALAATLSLSVSSDSLYADMPFTLTLKAEGFEEEPAPSVPELAIEGCETTFVGVSPSVSSHLQIVNGRRTEWKQVTFNYQWRVVAPAPGRYAVPSLRLRQGDVEAATQAATFEVGDVPRSADMVVRMNLPERAVWIGETFDVAVEWLLSREVESHEFAVPLFGVDGMQVQAPPGAGQQSMRFAAGAGEVVLPLERSQVRENGRSYTRFSFPARVTPGRAGTFDIDPVRVVARLQTGTGRDSWGFRRPRYELFRAEDQRRRLTVRPLPQSGRPDNFVNAIGSGFSIEVQANRTVVSVGDPIELSILVRGDGPLTGLSLAPLDAPGGLPPAHFGIAEDNPVGEVNEEARSKRFVVTARVKSTEVQEIPPIAFAYFDPASGEYRSAESRPIALSVGAGQLVGAGDVVAAPVATPPRQGAQQAADVGSVATLLGADMSLSPGARTLARPWGSDFATATTAALYLLPSGAFLAAFWLSRSGGRRQRSRDLRQARKTLESALGSNRPAREAAPGVAAAVRRLAALAGAQPHAFAATLERLETAAFDPAAAEQPLPDESVKELRQLARQWAKQAPRPASGAACVMLAACLLAGLPASAAAASAEALEEARTRYRAALDATDRLLRMRLFAEAEAVWRPLAKANPQAPAIQTDWGNAALGAQQTGRAVLAYRRALRLAPDDARAGANLAWLRDRQPLWLPRPAASGTLDSLLFWRQQLNAVQLVCAGAAAFAVGVLLLAPWSRRRPRWLRALAIPFLLAWAALSATGLATDDQRNAAVLLADGATLRSADSPGASPAFANPLPAGAEVEILEARDPWLRVALADGTAGWLSVASVEQVAVAEG